MARQMKAEREKRADILQAEGSAGSPEILKAAGLQRPRRCWRPKAAKRPPSATRRRASVRRGGGGEARPRVVSKAIAEGDVQAVNYFVAHQIHRGARERGGGGGRTRSVVMLPLEGSSNVIGSVAGVAELAKAAMETKKN